MDDDDADLTKPDFKSINPYADTMRLLQQYGPRNPAIAAGPARMPFGVPHASAGRWIPPSSTPLPPSGVFNLAALPTAALSGAVGMVPAVALSGTAGAASDVDACAVDVTEPPGRRLTFDITIDSGAGSSAINPEDVPEYQLEPSEGQAKGQHFIGAGGEKMPNLGQMTVPLMLADGTAAAATFQAAKVRKPLMAVSASCDQGQLVLFDNDLSALVDRDSPEGREIRRLVKQCVAKTTLQRKGGVYTLPAWIVPPEKLTDKDLQRIKPQKSARPSEALRTSARPSEALRTDAQGDVSMEPGFPRQGR